jgi:hypothetical protein
VVDRHGMKKTKSSIKSATDGLKTMVSGVFHDLTVRSSQGQR